MIPYDKFGNKIYENIYNILLRYGNILTTNGYIESKNKPNLFYKKIKDIMIFADLRGTDIVKIWDDTSPMIYIKDNSKNNIPDWKLRRILNIECQILNHNGCPTRFSFYSECEPDGLMFYEGDGYCRECGKDFQDNGLYCSKECEIRARKKFLAQYINSQPFCVECKNKIVDPNYYQKIKELLDEELVKTVTLHHISYEKDQTITVCSSCHSKIHHSKDPSLKIYLPESKRPKKESNYYTICEICGGKAKHDKEADEQVCFKCKHKCISCGEFTQCRDGVCYKCQKKELWGENKTYYNRYIFKYDPILKESNYDEKHR